MNVNELIIVYTNDGPGMSGVSDYIVQSATIDDFTNHDIFTESCESIAEL